MPPAADGSGPGRYDRVREVERPSPGVDARVHLEDDTERPHLERRTTAGERADLRGTGRRELERNTCGRRSSVLDELDAGIASEVLQVRVDDGAGGGPAEVEAEPRLDPL